MTVRSKKTCGFNGCAEHAVAYSPHCWDHIQDKDSYGSKFLEAAAGDKSLSGSNLKKVSLKNSIFEGVDLTGSDLSQADLSGSHFFDSKFKNATFIGTDMSGCDFTHCDLTGADLTKARLSGARLWNSDLSSANLSESDLSSGDLWNTRLFNTKLWHADLEGVKSLGRSNFSDGKGFRPACRLDESGEISAEESYRQIKQSFMANGKYSDASWASFKEKTMERRMLWKKKDLNYLPSALMNVLCGYGEKPYRIIFSAFFCILAFAFAYRSLGAIESIAYPGGGMRWLDYIYYSTITYTTVGYGDFIPKPYGLFRLLAACEAFLGVFLAGLFVFTLARKYSAR